MVFTLSHLISFLVLGYNLARKVPEVRILIMSQQTGYMKSSAEFINTRFMVDAWYQHLQDKALSDPTWPFNATIEFHDCRSDNDYTAKLLKNRFLNAALPPITVIMGPEDKVMTPSIVKFASKHNIPYVYQNSMNDYPRPANRNTTFSILPPTMYINVRLIQAYVDHGVKTLAAVAMLGVSRNIDACFGVAEYAQSRGIEVLAQYSLTQTMTRSDIYGVVKDIRDNHNPDAVIWCDYYSAFPAFLNTFNPMPIFKELNYLPKALSLLDNLDHPGLAAWKAQGLFQYVTSGGFVCDRMTGSSFTEGSTPFSSLFRYQKTVNSWNDEVNLGVTTPSSAQLFYAWYQSANGILPHSKTLAYWAAFDVVEAALYQAAVHPVVLKDGIISPLEFIDSLKKLQTLTTPAGRVILNENGDNTFLESLVLQDLTLKETADIVYPLKARTASMVYPMPTWDERIYNWDLTKGTEKQTTLVIAFICSVVLLTIAVTAIVHRSEPDIRMFHYLHIVSLCFAGIICCLAQSLVWQKDNRESQCKSFLWVIGLPASYLVHLVNMKAYRLAIFIYCNADGRRRRFFSHMKVLQYTLYWWMLTVVILAIVTIVDPPIRTRIVVDPYRPVFDEHRCISGTVGNGLIAFLLVVHVVVSLVCVISIRNGSGDFRDGLVMKESFIILYIFIAVSILMFQLSLSSTTLYVLRSVLLCLGTTCFLLRLLISRCIAHWIPKLFQKLMNKAYTDVIGPFISLVNGRVRDGSGRVAIFIGVRESFACSNNGMGQNGVDVKLDKSRSGGQSISTSAKIKTKLTSEDDKINEMIDALRDPYRLSSFKDLAKKGMAEENLQFLLMIMKYDEYCENAVVSQSSVVNDELRALAVQIYDIHIKQNDDVTLSSTSRAGVERAIKGWKHQSPLVSREDAKMLLNTSEERRTRIFEEAFKEISVFMYHNLWSKFRFEESSRKLLGE